MCLKYFPILQSWQKKIRRTKWWAYGGFPFLLGLFLQILIQNPDWVPTSVRGRKWLGSLRETPRKSSRGPAGYLRFKSRLAHQRDSLKTVSFFVSPSWPKPVHKPFVNEKRVFSILLSPALVFASVCKYCHLFCRCTVGLDTPEKSLAVPYSKLYLRNLQRYFTVTITSSSVHRPSYI